MKFRDFLRYGETNPRASFTSAPSDVHPVKTFENPRQMLARDANSRISYGASGLSVEPFFQADGDRTSGRGVLNRGYSKSVERSPMALSL